MDGAPAFERRSDDNSQVMTAVATVAATIVTTPAPNSYTAPVTMVTQLSQFAAHRYWTGNAFDHPNQFLIPPFPM